MINFSFIIYRQITHFLANTSWLFYIIHQRKLDQSNWTQESTIWGRLTSPNSLRIRFYNIFIKLNPLKQCNLKSQYGQTLFGRSVFNTTRIRFHCNQEYISNMVTRGVSRLVLPHCNTRPKSLNTISHPIIRKRVNTEHQVETTINVNDFRLFRLCDRTHSLPHLDERSILCYIYIRNVCS